MILIKVKDGQVDKYPYSRKDLAFDFPNTSFPEPMVGVDLSEFGVFVVAPSAAPQYSPSTQKIYETTPVLANGVWTQQWKIDELTPDEIEANRIAAIPASVSPRQIRQALTRVGLRQQVETAVAAADQDTKDWYEYATEFIRTNSHVLALASSLSVTERQLDDLWTLAGSL